MNVLEREILRERTKRHLEEHPEATVSDILQQFELDSDGDRRQIVEHVLAEVTVTRCYCRHGCGTVMDTYVSIDPAAPESIPGGYCDDCKEDLAEVKCPNCGRSYKPDLEPRWSESVIPAGKCSDCWPNTDERAYREARAGGLSKEESRRAVWGDTDE